MSSQIIRETPEIQELFEKMQKVLSHDPLMARCVLDGNTRALESLGRFRDCLKKAVFPLEWMGRLATLAGIFLFSKFSKWRKETGSNPTGKDLPNALFLKRLFSGLSDAREYFIKPSTALRVLRVMDGLYDSFDMSFFVIKYIIINSQIEAGYNKKAGLSKLLGFPQEKSFLVSCDHKDYFSVPELSRNLSGAFNWISACRSDPNLDQTMSTKYPPDKIKLAFEDIFDALSFMARVKLDIDSEGIVNFIETCPHKKEEKIPSNGVIRLFEKVDETYFSCSEIAEDKENIDFFMLEKMEVLKNEATVNSGIKFAYRSFSEKESLTAYFIEKEPYDIKDFKVQPLDLKVNRQKSAMEFYKRVSGYYPVTHTASSFYRGMLTTHYRYHNILAPAIVDALCDSRDAKVRILKTLVVKDEKHFFEMLEPVFKALQFSNTSELNDWQNLDFKDKIDKLCAYIENDDYRHRRIVDWDTLIMRVLIYDGPTEVIRTLLLDDNKSYSIDYKDTIKSICNHIIAGLEMRYIDEIFDAREVSNNQKENYKRVFKPKIDRYKELFPGQAAKIECKALVQSYIDTIVEKLTNIERADKNEQVADNVFAENNILDAIEIMENNKTSKNFKVTERAFLQSIISFLAFYDGLNSACQHRMNYEFEKSSKILSQKEIESFKKEIESEFLVSVESKASELFLAFSKVKGGAIELALKELWAFANMSYEDTKRYNALLARPPISRARLEKIFFEDAMGELMFIDERDEKLTFEEVYEDDSLLVSFLEKILRFLQGEDVLARRQSQVRIPDKSDYGGYKEHAKTVIYPQVVTFSKHKEDGDSNDCLIMDHTGAFAPWHDGEVQILTEFKYTLNYAYYVLPNINRIETEWWVDPFLISCKNFDAKIKQGRDKANEN